MKRLNVLLEDDIMIKFKKRCIDKGKTMSQVLRELVSYYSDNRLVVRLPRHDGGNTDAKKVR